jgi:hypothetical protein
MNLKHVELVWFNVVVDDAILSRHHQKISIYIPSDKSKKFEFFQNPFAG